MRAALGVLLLCAGAMLAIRLAAAAPVAPPGVSDRAQALYQAAKPRLFQIRVLLKQQGNQASAGSGFSVSGDGRIVTNYHVIAQLALEPENYRAVASDPGGGDRALTLLAIDVRNDLAVLRFSDPAPPSAHFDWAVVTPRQGERLYALGNPLDIGFAVVEGTYNGVPPRTFTPRMLFTGAINPGMSGGPVLDRDGRVVGVNVSKHLGGELVSFLVPAHHARALVARATRPLALPAHAEVTRQLTRHQAALMAQVLASPFPTQRYGRWKVPKFDDRLARCWGATSPHKPGTLKVERGQCGIDSALFTGLGDTGTLALRHEVYDGDTLGALRFARLYSASLSNEEFPARSRTLTATRCREAFIEAGGPPLRGIVCARAHKKFPGLYDFSVIAMTLDAATRGVQGRLDATGVSFANGTALARHYLGAYAWSRSR